MTHPLTEKMIEEMSYLVEMLPWYEEYPDDYEHDCRVVGMRAAADWQLERDAEYFTEYLVSIFGLDPEVAQVRATHFKEAMRPQVVDLPQANSDVCGEEGIKRARQQTLEENDELIRLLADS